MDTFDEIEARSRAYHEIGQRARRKGAVKVCLLGEHGGIMHYEITCLHSGEVLSGTVTLDDVDQWVTRVVGQMLVNNGQASVDCHLTGAFVGSHWSYDGAQGTCSLSPDARLN